MSLLVDSADIGEVRTAMALGYVAGVTTNPTLVARTRRPSAEIIREICDASRGPVFYQVTGATPREREQEGREFHAFCPDRIVLKIPATAENMVLIAALSGEITCAATAVYSAQQAWTACQAGAGYVIPYVNRATRLLGDGMKLVAELAAAVAASGTGAEILAASLKSPDEAAAAVVAGAHHITLPLDVLRMMGDHPLSDQAIEQFRQDAG